MTKTTTTGRKITTIKTIETITICNNIMIKQQQQQQQQQQK